MNGWTVFEILINIYQGFLFIYFINRVTHAGKHPVWIDAVSIGIITIFLSLYLFIDIPFIDTVVFIVPFIHALIVSREKWYLSLLWAVVLAVISLAIITQISNGFMALNNVPWETIMSENHYRMTFVFFCNIALFIILFAITRLAGKRGGVSILSFIVLLVLNLLLLLSIELLFRISTEYTIATDETEIVNSCLFLASIVSLALYELMSWSASRRQEAETKLRVLQQAQDQQAKLQSMYSAMLEYQHALKHQYQVLEDRLKSGKAYSSEDDLLLETAAEDIASRQFISTGNLSVDALLIASKSVMDASRIQFEYMPYPLDVLPIAEMDFCIMLSNLLDNAIEAVKRLPPDAPSRKVILKFARVREDLIIIVRNDYLPSTVRIEGGRYISSKTNKAMHGYGLENVESICEAADGSCYIKRDDNMFSVRIILPY